MPVANSSSAPSFSVRCHAGWRASVATMTAARTRSGRAAASSCTMNEPIE